MNPIIAVEKRFLKGLLGVHKRRKKGLLYVAFSSTFKKLIKLRIFLSVYVQIFHAMENLTDGKITESISNVFRSANRSPTRQAKVGNCLQTSTSNSDIVDT